MIPISRRSLLLGSATAGLGLASLPLLPAHAQPVVQKLTVVPGRFPLTAAGVTEAMMCYNGDAPPPVLRLKQGVPARIEVTNGLQEVTTVHWHGLRVPNAMDGVPWLTQYPIGTGETFVYEFTPEDAGTFWYHPHCNTLEQISRGLAGMIIVDEAQDQDFDADIPVLIRDFRLGSDGQFIEFYKPRNLARGGTLGTVNTANWSETPVAETASGSLIRLRLAITDVTRVYQLKLRGADGAVLSWDGQPIDEPIRLAPDTPLVLGPGQRADLAVAMSSQPAELFMILPDKSEHVLLTLNPTGSDRGRGMANLRALPPNPLAKPDLTSAGTIDLVFGWSASGDAPNSGGLCGDVPLRFWSINRKPWTGDSPPDPTNPGEPLAVMERDKTYILNLLNETQNDHPIHLHGLVMHDLGPDGQPNGRRGDTILLRSHDSARVAVVADSPGDWVIHCHVIEHQKTGLAGFVRVT
ncbi:MAG: copper oxidase [Cereibacter sphaeroides]|uniref:Copper oxidase n=1 Tax=Cereibacter sphaeroides TaxID=1063 RepID=A0A2W5USF0_CERSP|nr:MAG: copper oxidase [Cereibacter sphaeroides]